MTSAVHRDWLARHPTLPLIAGMPMLREQDAVLACAVGCDLARVAPFVRSLRAVFAGQVILLIDRKPTLTAWLSTHGVETVIAADSLPHWQPQASVARFALYAQLLQERREIRNAILAEVRDVVFQADPFRDRPAELNLYETPALGSALNARAMQALIGETLAANLAKLPPVSLGVIAGPSADVTRFCRAMLLLCDMPRSGLGGGVEHAACHVIAHLGLVGGEVRREFGRVAFASSGLRVQGDRIFNPDDGLSPILVGWGRSPDLADHVARLWGLPPTAGRGHDRLRRTMRRLQTSFLGGAAELC